MRTVTSVKSDSSISSRIEAAHMSEHERQLTLDAIRHADLFADGLLWTMTKLGDLSEQLFGKSTVKH
jgi:hypothetical protein